MPNEVEIRRLRPDDDRRRFTCGQSDLDRFFHHYAGQNQFKYHLAVTYVATIEARLLGFATVSASSLERRNIPTARLRRRLPSYPLPVLRLARLGVDEHAQGLGVGRALLRFALSLALNQRESVGCIGVVTDAKPDAIDFYTRYGFEPLEGVLQGGLHGDPTSLFLAIGTVEEALG